VAVVALMLFGAQGTHLGEGVVCNFLLLGCVIGLLEWGFMLASMLFWVVFGEWLWEVDLLCCTLVGWFYLKIVVC